VIGGSPGTVIGGIEMGGTLIGGIVLGGCGPGVVPGLWQEPCRQLVPGTVQILPVQQGCSAAPQGTQPPPSQTVPAAQAPPAQQAWPASPHGWQVPLRQTSAPAGVSCRQGVSPAQHACPAAPQLGDSHVPPTQTPTVQLLPGGQQGCPVPPQARQVSVLPSQKAPAAQVLLGWQQSWVGPPQSTQVRVDASQTFPAWHSGPPARQQG
jgi:hypothetical protein